MGKRPSVMRKAGFPVYPDGDGRRAYRPERNLDLAARQACQAYRSAARARRGGSSRRQPRDRTTTCCAFPRSGDKAGGFLLALPAGIRSPALGQAIDRARRDGGLAGGGGKEPAAGIPPVGSRRENGGGRSRHSLSGQRQGGDT